MLFDFTSDKNYQGMFDLQSGEGVLKIYGRSVNGFNISAMFTYGVVAVDGEIISCEAGNTQKTSIKIQSDSDGSYLEIKRG